MRKLILPLLIVALYTAAAPSASAGYWQKCPPTASYMVPILSLDVPCDRAKAVIGRVYSKGQRAPNPDGSVTVDGFRCYLSPRYGTPRSPARPLSCQRGSKRLKAAMP